MKHVKFQATEQRVKEGWNGMERQCGRGFALLYLWRLLWHPTRPPVVNRVFACTHHFK